MNGMVKRVAECAVSATFLFVALFLIAGVAPANGGANELADAVRELDDGKLRFSFAAKPGVYGSRHGIYISRDGDADDHDDDADDWRTYCDPCPVHVVLTVRDGDVRRVKSRVGARWTSRPRKTSDLGEVDARDAAEYLMSLVREVEEGVAEEAVSTAVLADGVVLWPRLLEIARDRSRSSSLRQTAIFWVGQAAQEAVITELGDFIDDDDEDMEVRRQAIFALSQRPDTQSTPALMRIARAHRSPRLRETALFWLAQKDDPEVIDFFEEILSN